MPCSFILKIRSIFLVSVRLNVVGIGIGTTLAGWTIDTLRTAGVDTPYTWTGLIFGMFGLLALPAFFYAGKRFKQDRERMAV